VGYAGLDPATTGAVFLTGRGLYGTPRGYHDRGEPVTPLLFWPVSPLAQRMDADDAQLPVADASGFPQGGGLVWVEDELIEYTSVEDGMLVMPSRPGSSSFAPEGVLRGRFGTEPVAHDAGALVRWMPARYHDRALLGQGAGDDLPVSESLTLGIDAPGAFFTDLVAVTELPDASVGLEARVVADGRVSPHADPARHAEDDALTAGTLFGGGEGRLVIPLGLAADRLDVHLFAVWKDGAFDPLTYRAQGWKQAPAVGSVVLGHIQPNVTLVHEEWQ
jgi:hypothetical protein